jgi:CheY-like chemotaxis protein
MLRSSPIVASGQQAASAPWQFKVAIASNAREQLTNVAGYPACARILLESQCRSYANAAYARIYSTLQLVYWPIWRAAPCQRNRLFTFEPNIVRATAESRVFTEGCCATDPGDPMPRVLVVDDQPEVRTIISIVLRMHRYEIVEAASAAAALNLFAQASFDLAIVDIFLESTNGSDLIAALRARAPGLPIIAISGMDFEAPELSDVVRLPKPFRPAELLRAIEAARGSHPVDAVAAG